MVLFFTYLKNTPFFIKKARENKKIADDIKNEEEEERSKLLLLQLDM